MNKYHYTAKTESGKTIRGKESAQDEEELYQKLRGKELYLLSARLEEPGRKNKRIKTRIIAEFCRELGTLLHAGVPLIRALTIISQEETVKPAERKIYDNLLLLLRQGTSFSDAIQEQGSAFPELMIQMLRTAEAGGNLDQVCARLAAHYEREYKLNSKLKSAMAYPCVLAGIIVVVVIIIFTYVMPQFSTMFMDMEDMPASTEFLFWLSDAVQHYWLQMLVGLALVVALIRAILTISKVKYGIDRIKLKIPVVGRLLRTIYTARFARTLSSLYASGLPMITALQIGSKTIGNFYIEQQFIDIIARIRTGESMSETLAAVDGFISKFASSIMVGEETGKLDDMLNSMADTLDFESERAIEGLVAMIEPLMIVMMALIVGFIVISVIGPIYSSYDTIGAGA